MTIRFRCRGCFKGLEVPEDAAGAETECPHCMRILVVPRPKSQRQMVGASTSSGTGESTWDGDENQRVRTIAIENPILRSYDEDVESSSQSDLSILAADLAQTARSRSQYQGQSMRYPAQTHYGPNEPRTGKYQQLDRSKNRYTWLIWGSLALIAIVVTVILLAKPKAYGESFQVITGVSESGQLYMHGYSYHQHFNQDFAAGSAFLVAKAGGITLGGRYYPTGTVVLVSDDVVNGTSGFVYFKRATPKDRIILKHTVSVENQLIQAGHLNILPNGQIAGLDLSDLQSSTGQSAVASDRVPASYHF